MNETNLNNPFFHSQSAYRKKRRQEKNEPFSRIYHVYHEKQRDIYMCVGVSGTHSCYASGFVDFYFLTEKKIMKKIYDG